MYPVTNFNFVKLILVVSLFLVFQNTLAIQQNKATLSGYVKDAKTEEPLIGATVQLVGTNTGAVTDLDGFYRIENIEPQTYAIAASFVGYKTQNVYNVVIRSGGNPDLNFDLEETAEELEGVEIIANPFEKLQETPLSVQRLSQEEIATYPGGNNDIAKVVQSLPGVSGSVGGFRNDVIIRGGAPNENVYYLDGIEIPNINHFSTQGSAGGPVGLLNVSFFEGVTLTTSSFGAQYDNVLSGVLQFDQRNGNNRNFRTNIRVSSSEAALTLEGPLFRNGKEQSNTSFIVSARRSYLQLLFQVLDLPFLPDYWDYQYKISHKINDYNDLTFTGVGSIDDFSINVPDDYDEEQQATLDQLPIIKQWSTTSGLSWKRRFKNGQGFMTTALSTNVLNNNFKRYREPATETELYLTNESQEQETKLRYNYTRFADAWTLNSGFIIQNADYSNTTEDIVNGFQFSNELNFWRYGAYFQASRNFLSERLGLSGGFRIDGNSFTKSGNDLLSTLSPRFSISYKLDAEGKWTANASLGRYFKIPPYTILGFTDNNGVYTNKDAKYIQSDHIVAGVEHLLTPTTRISLEGFYKKYSDYPVSVTDSVSLANLGGDFSVLGNEPILSVGLGRTYGLEFLIQKKFTKNFYGILAYTLYKSEYTAFDKDTYISSTWDNGTLLTFTGGYKLGRNWEISARVRYLGETPYAPVDQAATLANYPAIIRDYSRQGTVTLDPFNQTDLRIDKKWNFKGFTFNLFLEFLNLFSQQNPSEPTFGLVRDDDGNVVQPRTLKQIEDLDASSVLPSIGIVLDF
uniref:TonB-dependent receptor n=1 Tax=Fulvivirga sp. TaxID=1931237 RepID=UPI004048EEB2